LGAFLVLVNQGNANTPIQGEQEGSLEMFNWCCKEVETHLSAVHQQRVDLLAKVEQLKVATVEEENEQSSLAEYLSQQAHHDQ
jgi:hypothetical protein